MHDQATLKRLGFMTQQGSTHTARTIMLSELNTLFDHVAAEASKAEYLAAIRDANCLGKRSGRSRKLTASHLAELYGLDPANPIHAGLRYFWSRDEAARPQLALLAGAARDSLLRDLAPAILAKPLGTSITRESVEQAIEQHWPGRFSTVTRESIAQRVNSSLVQVGYLLGPVKKLRVHLEPATGAVAFALYLAWLQGGRGELLLQSPWCKLLDASQDRLLELAAQASAKGWMVMRRVDNVVDLDFPALASVVTQALTSTEPATASQQEIFHEQS
ncbi:hypothetical protein [Halomonas sp. M4R1S46]|uniref:hypothetical protein n=1 Tax=Halomonas sp. M4R1S46 TaxID=2982692 RepID=UPI0021E4D8E2|nr:hypothetical protein [Halomonas sp. M4R1S46]UYG08066.1 hypothetical protein OCT48_01570 [Halomonas sp. M4R1S46]